MLCCWPRRSRAAHPGGRGAHAQVDFRQAFQQNGPRRRAWLDLLEERYGHGGGHRHARRVDEERVIENAAAKGERLLASFRAMVDRYELVKEVRGKGAMIGIEFGAPKSIALKMSWHALEAANKGLFCQMITIPLFKEHKILVQVAGHGIHTIKMLPPLTITDEDCTWIETPSTPPSPPRIRCRARCGRSASRSPKMPCGRMRGEAVLRDRPHLMLSIGIP